MLKYLLPLGLIAASGPQSNSCLILGADTARRVAEHKPQCDLVAMDHRGSKRILETTPSRYYDHVILSVGENDSLNPKLGQNMFAIRRKVNGRVVTWLVPYQRRAEQRAFETATHFHDRVIYLRKFKEDKNNLGSPKDFKAVAKAL